MTHLYKRAERIGLVEADGLYTLNNDFLKLVNAASMALMADCYA